MKKYIALLLVFVMLLLTACGTAQPQAGGTLDTGSTEPCGTTETLGIATSATENTTQSSTGEATAPTEGTTNSTEPSANKPTDPAKKPAEPTTKPTDGNHGTGDTEKPPKPTTTPTTQPTGNTKPSVAGTLTFDTPNNTALYVGDTLQLQFSYTGNKADLTFQSIDLDILTVTNSGLITGKTAGVTQVRVFCGDQLLGTRRIKVEKVPVVVVLPEAKSVEITSSTGPWKGVAGNYITFTAFARTVKPSSEGGNQKVTASSSNPSVATVGYNINPHGYISGSNHVTFKISFKRAGSTDITVTSEDGKVSKTFTVTVKADYACNPGKKQLTPEEWANCATKVMAENGFKENSTGLTSYLMLTVKPQSLTWSGARGVGEGYARHYWSIGLRSCYIKYIGINEDGKYIFNLYNG